MSAGRKLVIVGALLALVTFAAVQFLMRYARWRHAGVTVALAVQVLIVPATLAMAGTARLHSMAVVWELLFAFEIAVAAGWHLCFVVLERLLDGEPVVAVRGDAAREHGWADLRDGYAVKFA